MTDSEDPNGAQLGVHSAIELPVHEFQEWVRRLQRRVVDLQTHFKTEVKDNGLFESIVAKDADGAFVLRPIQDENDLLCVVCTLMNLAGHTPTPISCATGVALQNLTIHSAPNHASHNTIYQLLPLRNATTQIRLAHLLPGNDVDELHMDLVCVDDLRSHPYEAVSYVWGNRDGDVTIIVNQSDFDVSANLAATLRDLRYKDRSRILWIDAICINQADSDEKSAQVQLMGQIYRSAAQVVIFVGDEADDSGLVMQYLNLEHEDDDDRSAVSIEQRKIDSDKQATSSGTQQEATSGDANETDPATHQEKTSENKKKSAAEREAEVEALILRAGLDRVRFLRAAEIFFRRPYFTRMWVVQEFVLAVAPPLWYCGRASTSAVNVRSRLADLYAFITDKSMPINGDPAVANGILTGSPGSAWLEMYSSRWNVSRMLRDRWDISLHPAQGVIRTLFRQCTDPRDKVFAMRDIWDPISREVFPPDYTTNLSRIYPAMTAYLLLADEWGEVYGNLQLLPGLVDRPSWAVDFTRPFLTTVSSLMFGKGIYGKTSWMERKGQMSVYGNVLGVSGVELDTVDLVFPIDGGVDDLALLEQVWRVSVAFTKLRPSKPLSELAETCIPPACRVPFRSVREIQHKNTILSNVAPVAGDIPGYMRCVMETQRLAMMQPPQWQPEKLKCESWRQNAFQRGWDEYLRTFGGVLLASTTQQDDDSFLAGAVWDLETLQAQIQAVKLQSSGELEPTKMLPHCPDHHTIPHYSHICHAIAQARDEQELSALKNLALTLAEMYRQIIDFYRSNPTEQKLSSTADMLEGISLSNKAKILSNILEWQALHDSCSCEGEDHRRMLKQLMNQARRLAETESEARAMNLPTRAVGSYDHVPGIAAALKRQYKCFFVTRSGFVGVSYQDRHEIEKGDKVLLLDGIPCPMVVRSTGTAEAGLCRMQTAAVIVGVEKFDISKLMELGLCERRDWRVL